MSIFKGWPTLTEIFFGKEKAKEMAKPKVAPKVATKKATKKVAKKEAKPTKKELGKLTKVQLEELGRQKGIELDRRLKKDKLVVTLHKAL
ncbi:MAG: hypothetical protein CMA64_08740 [Euryarchaeota archaeon]|jgi:hypothetical protein|nr:hypothetical protein [Euryarchaeota archaeon]